MSTRLKILAVEAVPQNLFPTFDTQSEALNYAYSRLPIVERNEIHAILMVWQNTLLNTIQPSK